MAGQPNRKKAAQRVSKEDKPREYPLLNLYILVVGFLQVMGEIFNVFFLRMLKPVPMVLMILYISGKNSQRDHLVPTLIRAGLILSLVGDVCLMVDELSAFMVGTGFFFVAHILYCVAFRVGTVVREASLLNQAVRWGLCALFVAMCFSNIHSLWNLMPNRLLFSSYALVLCMMNIFAILRYQITTPYSFGFIVAGAVLFGLSDNLLAFLKFNKIPSDLGRGIVMLLYYGGQYLLMHGAMHHSNLQHEITKFFKTSSPNVTPVLAVGKAKNSRQWDHGEGDELPINIAKVQ